VTNAPPNSNSPSAAKTSPLKTAAMLAIAGVCAAIAAYVVYKQLTYDPYAAEYGSGPIAFSDHVTTNADPAAVDIGELPLFDSQGKPFDLKQFRDRKNVVLVITRGWTGGAPAGAEKYYVGNICLYCATQTSRLANNYQQFADRDAEVIVVFPVLTREGNRQLTEFEQAVARSEGPSKLPFPLTLDLELAAVDRLGIRKDLSKPATYILDKQGKVQFAYVGSSLADRPSVKAMLDQLDAIQRGE